MLTNDIKQILENYDGDAKIVEAIMKLVEEIEELQNNKGSGFNEEDSGLSGEVDRLSDKINDLDNDDELKELEKRIEVLENKE